MFVKRLALLISLTMCAASAAPAVAQPKPYTIDAIVSLTGPAAFLGKEIQQSLLSLEATTNAHGGIHGTLLHFEIADDQSNPQTAVQLANAILAKKPPILLGSDVVATCLAIAALTKNGPLQYCFSPAIHPAAGTYLYSSGVSSTDNVAAFTRFFRLKGWKRIAVITSTDASGLEFEQSFDQVITRPENKDVVKLGSEKFAPGDVSVSAQVARIKALNPQALIIATTGAPFGTVLRALTDAGMNVPLATSTGNMTFAQMEQYAQFDVSNAYFSGLRFFDHANIGKGPLKDAIDTFYAGFEKTNVKPDVGQGFGWDPALITIAALRALGTNATSDQIKAWIDKQQSFIGVNGIYDFPAVPQRGLDEHAAVVATWNAKAHQFTVVSYPGGKPR